MVYKFVYSIAVFGRFSCGGFGHLVESKKLHGVFFVDPDVRLPQLNPKATKLEGIGGITPLLCEGHPFVAQLLGQVDQQLEGLRALPQAGHLRVPGVPLVWGALVVHRGGWGCGHRGADCSHSSAADGWLEAWYPVQAAAVPAHASFAQCCDVAAANLCW